MSILDNVDFLTDEKRNNINIKILKQAVEGGNVSHANLFYGNSMNLLSKLALFYSASINCNNSGCGTCSICSNTLKGIYSNVLVVEAMGSTLRIEEVFELQRFMNVSSYVPGKKICVIKEVELMNDEASNRLLKTLEEPPDKDCVFILLTEDISVILPTITSRCTVFKWDFNLEKDEDLKFGNRQLDDILNKGIKSIIKSEGSKGTGNSLPLHLSVDLINRLNKMAEKIKIWRNGELNKIKDSGAAGSDIKKYKKILESSCKRKLNKFLNLGMNKVFDIMSAWLEDIMAVKAGASEDGLNYSKNYFFIIENTRNVKIDKIFKLLETVEKNRIYLKYSIYKELALDNIFLQFQNLS